MSAGSDVAAGLAFNRRVMEQAHHRIAVAHGIDEIILVDLEEARDRIEDLEAGAVERFEQLLERVFETRDLGRPDVVAHVAAERMACGKIAADVPEFLEVMGGVALGSLDPERGVAARAAAALDEIFALHLFGQSE